jgi:MFS family permease
VRRWFDYYAYSPIEKLFRPNKHELWLHLSLLNSYAAKGSVLRRRLFPARLPGPVDAVYVGENELTLRRRLLRNFRYASHVAERALHHARVLPSVALHGVWWHSRGRGLTQKFWAFIGAASLFNFGLFIFVLTYNLYLLDHGYREDFLGFVNGAFTAGSVAGALPAGAILQRFGVGSAFQFCIGGTALISTMRALIPGDAAIIALAFVGGAFFSLWAVMIAPAIAQLTGEQTRTRAFSLFFGISIAVGVLGGLIGGHLPDWLETKQGALLCGCGFTLTALWPAKFLSFSTGYRSARPKYPFDSFIRRFLLALAGWNLAVGAFNPFFNIFFARHLNARMDQIGMIFSAGQLAQVAAMAAAPMVLKKLGLVNGVTATQIAAGTTLAMLTATNGIMSAATVYVCYAAFQYMSEPGVYTLLMSRVQPEEQSGASSLNFLATFSAHAISATIAGTTFSWYGYNRVVPVIAAVVILSAFLFRMLLRRFEVLRAGTVPE